MSIMYYMWYEILRQVMFDMQQPIGYIPCAIVIVILAFSIFSIVFNNKEKKTAVLYFYRILFAVYVLVVVQLAFFSREPGSRDGVNLVLLSTWGDNVYTHAFFVENILMFVPFGILVPLCFSWMRPMLRCILCGCSCSIVLELCQLWTKRGFCELDDVLTNTVGVFCGCIILRLLERLVGDGRRKA